MSELKACPFCGKDEANFTTDKWGNYYVECEYCGAQTNPYDDKEIVIEEWQTRPIEDDLRKRIAELEADNAEFRQLIRDWSIVLDQDDFFQLWHVESVRQAMLEINKEREE